MPTRVKKRERHVVIEWGDVRDKVLEVVGDGKPWKGINASHDHARAMMAAGKQLYGPPKCNKTGFGHKSHLCAYCRWEQQQNHQKNWSGGKWSDTMEWLRNGYRAPEFRHSAWPASAAGTWTTTRRTASCESASISAGPKDSAATPSPRRS
jgi:hypothetical protein